MATGNERYWLNIANVVEKTLQELKSLEQSGYRLETNASAFLLQATTLVNKAKDKLDLFKIENLIKESAAVSTKVEQLRQGIAKRSAPQQPTKKTTKTKKEVK